MTRLCRDCPRNCGVPRPDSLAAGKPAGFCSMPLAPVVARAGLHRWEEPVISGDRGSGTVFFSGCNLHCVFCQNHEISTLNRGREITVERLRAIYRELAEQGAHNLNLVTPSHFVRAVAASLEPAPPLPVVYNTNGYDTVASLRRLEGKVQIYLPDLKYADPETARRYSSAPDYFDVATRAILEMYRQTGPFQLDADGLLSRGVLIRHLVLPGRAEESKRVIAWVAEHFRSGEVMFSLMRQYLPCGRAAEGDCPELNRRVSGQEYQEVEQALFDSGLEDGFVQEEESAVADYIPSFDGSGV